MTRTNQTIVLVTGGAGYVGSHCVLQLLEQDYEVVIIDNCSNAYREEIDANGNLVELPESLRRVEQLTSRKILAFYDFDLADQTNGKPFDEIFSRYNIQVVLHFASFKSVNESIEKPLDYYTNNLIGTINLLNSMKSHGCKRMIFSSSATVYGIPQYLPVDESHQIGQNILNPYGQTKFMIEQILMDLSRTKEDRWQIIALRYFNPVGAHPSGLIGEHTRGEPNNLMPYVCQVSVKKLECLHVFGNDFDTPDGTGVRDFIHIMDLSSGHLCALKYLINHKTDDGSDDLDGTHYKDGHKNRFYKIYNLGTGRGYSVMEVIETFERINGVKVPFKIASRRQGDAGSVYADASLAKRELNWESKYSLSDMVRDAYKWQSEHPAGFKS